MEVLTKNNLKQLYEIDAHLWLEETIKVLKAKQLDELDLENLIEELESLAKRDLNKVRSLLRQIIIHILLLKYWSAEYERNANHWEAEIIAFREDLNNDLTTSLQNRLREELDHIYLVARTIALKKTKLTDAVIPQQCPYTLAQFLDGNWLPQTKK